MVESLNFKETYDAKVERICREICEELGQEPVYKEDGQTINAWRQHNRMVRDWLELEAFRKVRNRYWNSDPLAEGKLRK